jgi:hypothetical protein
MINIDKITKAEIEKVTGQTIPGPQSAAFEAFFEGLTREHPDLASKLEEALEITEPYPEEAAQNQARRRAGIAATVQRWFYKEVWGKRVLNRRALSLTIFFLIFGVMMTSWSFTFFRKPSRAEQTEQQGVLPEQAPVNETELADTEDTVPKETDLLIVPDVEVKNSPAPGSQSVTASSSNPSNAVPPRKLPQNGGSRPLEVPLVPQTSVQEERVIEDMPQTSVLAANEDTPPLDFKSSVTLFEAPVLATQPVLIQSAETASPEKDPVLAFTNDEAAPSQSPVIANTSESENATIQTPSSEPELARSPALAFGTEKTYAPSIQNAESTPQHGDQIATGAPPTSLETASFSNHRVTEQPSQNSQDEALLETDIFSGTATDLLKPGMLIPATLQKDIILTEGETRQVLADAVEDWCGEARCPALRWLGTATLSASGRLDVTFERAILEGELLELSGIAYGSDNAEGLPAHIADTTPTLLADLLRAGAGGVTDYVEGQANQQTVTRDDGTTITQENVPGLLEFILGRAAGTLQIPEGETGVIRLAAVEKGTRLEVLYLRK